MGQIYIFLQGKNKSQILGKFSIFVP